MLNNVTYYFKVLFLKICLTLFSNNLWRETIFYYLFIIDGYCLNYRKTSVKGDFSCSAYQSVYCWKTEASLYIQSTREFNVVGLFKSSGMPGGTEVRGEFTQVSNLSL